MIGRILGFVAAIAAFAIPVVGPMIGMTALAVAGATAGALIASSLLMGPAMPKIPKTDPLDRLHANLDPGAPRKIVFGRTALATDIRYQVFTGTDQDHLEQIICAASHQIDGFEELWLDNELAWTAAGGVQGRFSTGSGGPFLWVTPRPLGTSANGIGIDGTWTAAATLTGCAYVHLRFRLVSGGNQNDSPFASGVPSRMTLVGRAALLYDPRLDSTVPGGSGPQRADNQATWTYSAATASNPALQLLWYLLGWRINGKLAVGMGLPPARIDLASFITAANVCEQPVTLNGGGTERRYQSDGVFSEADDRRAVIDTLCAAMNGMLRDAGGRIALRIIVNDLASPVMTLNDNDILGDEHWSQTPELHESYNIVRGRRIDASAAALYQLVDFPEISLPSPDGIDRIQSVDFPTIQSNGQAQRLAKQRLQRAQYQGVFSAAFGHRALQLSIGDVVLLTKHGLGWTDKLFRVISQDIARSGRITMKLLEENAAIHAWANDEAPAVVIGTPVVYNPINNPLLVGIRDARTAIGNDLDDTQFRTWTFSSGAGRRLATGGDGFAVGSQPYFLELASNPSVEVSALSPSVPVSPGFRYFFSVRAQRGTTLGSGSRLRLGGQWLAADGVTVVGTFTEGAEQTPASLTAGALPREILWSGAAPTNAHFVRLRFYAPALANSTGAFRMENPQVLRHEVSADVTSWVTGPPLREFAYDHLGALSPAAQMPVDLAYQLRNAAGPITGDVTWTYRVIEGTVNGLTFASGVQAMPGTGVLTISSLGSTTASVTITGTAHGMARTFTTALARAVAAPPSSVFPLTKSSGFTSISNTTWVDVTGWLEGVLPAGKTAASLAAGLDFLPAAQAAAGSWTVELKWQREIAGVPTDVGGTVSATSSIADVSGGEPGVNPIWFQTPARITNNHNDTGLTAGVNYRWRCVARVSAGGTWSHSATGNVSVSAP